MRIFVAGASGVVGRRLVPKLVRAGHTVFGSARQEANLPGIAEAGAHPVHLDALDERAVAAVIQDAQPDVVVHQLTALTGAGSNLKKFDEAFADTNTLRTHGTDSLLAAARAAGVRRFVAASFTGWPNARTGAGVHDESVPLDAEPAPESSRSLAAIRHLEDAVTQAPGIEGLVLRYGMFYGRGTSLAPGAELWEAVRGRKLPVAGDGGGIWSFVHIDDAAQAAVLAVERGVPGLYNVVDDEPAPVATWLPFLAETIGVKRPVRLPVWLVRPLIGTHGVNLMTQIRGSDNTKARTQLGFTPQYPSWREGFTVLGR